MPQGGAAIVIAVVAKVQAAVLHVEEDRVELGRKLYSNGEPGIRSLWRESFPMKSGSFFGSTQCGYVQYTIETEIVSNSLSI